jgi:pimeloyl-ACP methyl ester carboxylesterase
MKRWLAAIGLALAASASVAGQAADERIIAASRSSLESRYNLVRLTEMPKGGHFAAFEQPQLFVTDIREFFRTVRGGAQ